MASHTPVTDRILGTWGQVFLEVDRLSRDGQVLVTLGTGGRYLIRLPDHDRESENNLVRS
jgi:predicted  nucleic acid-binding Zn-ribbon protein